MKRAIRRMIWAIALIFVAVVGVLAFVRLSPLEVDNWHVTLPMEAPAFEGPCADSVRALTPLGGATASCAPDGTPQSVLSSLDAIALATPRTRRIAGSPADGRITWETRSRLVGFPDYITAQTSASGATTRLDIVARQRFGQGDLGVNAARLKDWLSRL